MKYGNGMVVVMRKKFCIMEQKSLVLYLGKVAKERFRKDFNSGPRMASEGDGTRL